MHIRDLAGKKICILGYGREGQAVAEALQEHAKGCSIAVADKNPKAQATLGGRLAGNIQFHTGPHYLEHLDRCDVVIRSPGIPPHELLAIRDSLLTSSTQIFLDSIKDSGATVIGITGSKGKSTTSSLLHHILTSAGKHSFLVGNIGEPAISHLKDACLNTFFVQEMSSYQLMNLTSSPHIAVITSFFPEHLDYHGSLANYLEAKKHITRFQAREDFVFFHANAEGARAIADESKGTKIPFDVDACPVTLEEIRLKGEHNLGNIAAAYQVALHLGIEPQIAIEAIKTFQGLPHRLESLGVHDGIEWVNDSISTTPESAIAALDALGDRVATIILGGQDRGYDYYPLVERLRTSAVKTVILLPDSGATIRKKLEEAKTELTLIDAETMEQAVKLAKIEVEKMSETAGLAGPAARGLRLRKGEHPSGKPRFPFVILLSPAAPSYGHFKNFEDRGEQFGECINKRG